MFATRVRFGFRTFSTENHVRGTVLNMLKIRKNNCLWNIFIIIWKNHTHIITKSVPATAINTMWKVITTIIMSII